MLIRHPRIPPAPTPMGSNPGQGDLAVITCHFNWTGFQRPRQNLHRFIRQCRCAQIPLYGIEAYLPHQRPQTARIPGWKQIEADPATQIMFQKERLLNMAQALVPDRFTKLAWLDADIMFSNPNWHTETSVLLDHFPFVQPFEMAAWTDVDGREIFRKPSTLRMKGGLPIMSHPGFAMAARRSLWKEQGGLFEMLIVGNGDMGIASAILGIPVPTTQKYSEALHEAYRPWHEAVSQKAGGRYAFTRGTIWHEWHGSLADRRYLERNHALRELDPKFLSYGENGLLTWTDETPQSLKDYVRDYFIRRCEDGGAAPSGHVLSGGLTQST